MATIDAIKTLHTSMIDTRRAYEKAQEETQLPELKAFFGSMIALRQKDHGELHKVLTEMGETPDEDGSFMTTIHRAVIGVRSVVKGVDLDSLSAFASGEENILKEYDSALAQDDLHQATSELLRTQRAALVDKVGQMRALEAAG